MLLDVPDEAGLRLRGTIVNVCADPKGAHQLFGFAGTSFDQFCRIRLISRSDLTSVSKVGSFSMRNKENYNAAIKDIQARASGN